MSHTNFLYSAAFVFVLAFVVSASGADEKMNVLFIAADDMNCDLSVYGNSQVKTPNLERLMKIGVRFDNAYCQQPLCGPSRASLMTGLRPDTLDMHTLKHELRQKNPDVVTLGQLFRQNGYFSARAGKIYHYGNPGQIGTDANDDPATWDMKFNPAGIDKKQEDKITRYGPQKGGLGISMAWWDPESKDTDHTDGMVATKIIELINQKKDEPFFFGCRILQSTLPLCCAKKIF